jgi:hypothetical protein
MSKILNQYEVDYVVRLFLPIVLSEVKLCSKISELSFIHTVKLSFSYLMLLQSQKWDTKKLCYMS